jgi:hypothetical protein
MVFSNEQMLKMLGGVWPEFDEFVYAAVDHWECEDGIFIPYLGGLPMDGPCFELTITMSSFRYKRL